MIRKYGCFESPKDLRDFRVCSNISKITLPTEYKLMPTKIKDQGSVNSCVAHALSSMLEKKNETEFSTGWIYGYRPEGYYQGEGMYPREALKTLLNMGAVKEESFSYNVEMQKAKQVVDENLILLDALADEYKITAYARLYTISEIKSWLYTKNIPVPMSIATDNLKLDRKNIIEIPEVYPNCGHMMLIIGWNETGFIVQNSWGEAWGDKGTAILPYEYVIREAWGVTIDENAKDIKKPAFNIIRQILMILINTIKILIKGGNS